MNSLLLIHRVGSEVNQNLLHNSSYDGFVQVSPVNRNMNWIFNVLHNLYWIWALNFHRVWGWDMTVRILLKIASLEFWGD